MREVWGAFAVNDHLRRRAFVADLLLYDRLLVPFPSTEAERAQWRIDGWEPDALERTLEVIEQHSREAVLRVPWTDKRDAQVRRAWAQQVEVDRTRLQGNLYAAAGGRYSASRRYIVNEVEAARVARRDKRTGYLAGLNGVYGEVFPAYGSKAELEQEWSVQTPGAGTTADGENSNSRVWRLASMFRCELFVPEDSRRTDLDLLEEAVLLASRDDFREKRASFHALRREYLHAGLDDAEVLADLEERHQAYREITARTVLKGRLVNGLTIVGVGSAVAGTLTHPILALGAGLCELAKVAVHSMVPQRAIGEAQKPVAMLYDARRAFG
jgi:hypothetical protein